MSVQQASRLRLLYAEITGVSLHAWLQVLFC